MLGQLDPSVPELFAKVRRPFEDTLRVLGVKDVDAYLPTLEEAGRVAASKAEQGPSAEQKEVQSKVDLNNAKVEESKTVSALNMKKAQDIDTDDMFEAIAAKRGKLSSVQVD